MVERASKRTNEHSRFDKLYTAGCKLERMRKCYAVTLVYTASYQHTLTMCRLFPLTSSLSLSSSRSHRLSVSRTHARLNLICIESIYACFFLLFADYLYTLVANRMHSCFSNLSAARPPSSRRRLRSATPPKWQSPRRRPPPLRRQRRTAPLRRSRRTEQRPMLLPLPPPPRRQPAKRPLRSPSLPRLTVTQQVRRLCPTSLRVARPPPEF